MKRVLVINPNTTVAVTETVLAACRRGRFAIVTGRRAWAPMLARFARAHELDAQLAGIHTVDLTGAQIAADPERAFDDLAAACARGIDGGAECILLGGAALAGLAARLQPLVAAPVLDNVLLAAQAVTEASLLPPSVQSAPGQAKYESGWVQ